MRTYVVIAICFGPTLLAMASGLILLPHQIRILLIDQVEDAAFPLAYFLSGGFLMVGVMALLRRMRQSKSIGVVSPLFIVAGLPSIALGPVGTFALMRYEGVGVFAWAAFVVMSLGATIFLLWSARRSSQVR